MGLDAEGVPVTLAFLAGVLSFLSPCQLAVLPGFVSYLSGASAQGADRARIVRRALVFILGFSSVFVGLGASAGLVGSLLYDSLPLLRQGGGAVLIAFGLHFLGLLPLPLLDQEARLSVDQDRRGSSLGALALGVIFGFGWTPCVGPTLAGILLLASASETVGQGALLLALYSAGLALPFLATALALGSVGRLMRRVNRRGNLVTLASGVLLIGLGMLLIANRLELAAALFGGWLPFDL